MEKFGKSQPVKRVEDQRFLTGQGRYVDDIAPEDALHGYVFRASVAHAQITELNVADARAASGVHLVLTAADLEKMGVTLAMAGSVLTNRDGTRAAAPERPLLARTRVRFVGEPVAMIFADSVQQAKDAAELIEFDYDDLPAHVELAKGGEELHSEAPNNHAFDWGIGDEAACTAALESAVHRLSFEIEDNRIIPNSMEPRGCYAEPEGERLHIAINGQGVWAPKAQIAKHLGVEPDTLRVTNPDTGGGFGTKAMVYPEYPICAAAARKLGRAVRWMSERGEAMMSDNAGRDLVTHVEMGFDADHKLVAYRLDTTCNLGAYNSQFAQPIQTDLFSKVMTGCYDIGAAYLHVDGVYTNTTQVDAYRGAGRPEAIYVLERAMDYAARALGADPWELRRRNFIAPDAFPYTTPADVTYDIGEFARVLDVAQIRADHAGYEKRRNASRMAGKLRGMGLCYYIESILGDPSENAKVVFFEQEGRVSIYVGTQSNGQGHETVYAQFLSDHSGIPMDRIDVIQGDSDRIPQGGGTGGSRSVTVQNTATLATVEKMIAQFTPFLADKMGVNEESVVFDDEAFRADGSNESYTMIEAAELASADGRNDLLSTQARTTLDARSFPNGAHVAEVEIDPETGVTELVRYTVVDDFGNLINPMLVEGQVHGGVAQGLGQALTERVVYDEDGQLLTASFMDYAMPRADDIPMISFSTEAVPTGTNPMGMKGCGEAGTVGALAAISNAVQDAVAPLGVARVDMPFTPHRVWALLQQGDHAA